MKTINFTMPANYPLQSYRDRFHTVVDRVEVATEKDTMIYRITYSKLLLPGYFVVEDENGSNVGSFIHHCEANQEGKSCVHLGAAVILAEDLGVPLKKITVKTPSSHIEKHPYQDLEYTTIETTIKVVEPPSSVNTPRSKGKSASQNWKEGWKEIEQYLTSQNFTRGMIGAVQEKRKHVCDKVSLQPICTPPIKPVFPYEGEILARAVRHVISGRDLLLVGGKGTGKDTLCSTLAWIFGLPLLLVTGNVDETRESVVGGAGFKDNQTTFENSPFTQCLEQGGITHYAELNMMSGDVTSIFHSVLDDNKVLPTPNGVIKRHPHHLFIGSINLGEGYAGVKTLNDALKDRLAVIHLPYAKNFRGMIERKTGVTSASILSLLEKVRSAIKRLISEENQGDSADTIRGYIAAAEHLQKFGTTEDIKAEALEDFIVNRVEDLDERMAVRQAVRLAWAEFPVNDEEEHYEGGY